ncbi:unnamed protein product [Fusarium graminearum]|uniref:Uncharacterized protein n=1 Tax=Gibberella zeae TaxID=5518 RepID=A0A9N8NBF2_GIBZA|nr:unnamed protein product [Fusarium graminearum]
MAGEVTLRERWGEASEVKKENADWLSVLPDLRDMSDPEANKLEEPPAGRAALDKRRDAAIDRRAAVEL